MAGTVDVWFIRILLVRGGNARSEVSDRRREAESSLVSEIFLRSGDPTAEGAEDGDLARARDGDDAAFTRLVEPLRRELHARSGSRPMGMTPRPRPATSAMTAITAQVMSPTNACSSYPMVYQIVPLSWGSADDRSPAVPSRVPLYRPAR